MVWYAFLGVATFWLFVGFLTKALFGVGILLWFNSMDIKTKLLGIVGIFIVLAIYKKIMR